LRFATLSGANLASADLSGADLTDARVDGANLTNADLSHTLLNRSDFAGANLAGARLEGTNLALARNLTQDQIVESLATPSPCFPTISNLRCRPSRLAAGVARCLGWSEAGPSRRQCRKSNRNSGALQDVARLAHDVLLDRCFDSLAVVRNEKMVTANISPLSSSSSLSST
jgi:Pentapeptide repeats (8 copies)